MITRKDLNIKILLIVLGFNLSCGDRDNKILNEKNHNDTFTENTNETDEGSAPNRPSKNEEDEDRQAKKELNANILKMLELNKSLSELFNDAGLEYVAISNAAKRHYSATLSSITGETSAERQKRVEMKAETLARYIVVKHATPNLVDSCYRKSVTDLDACVAKYTLEANAFVLN